MDTIMPGTPGVNPPDPRIQLALSILSHRPWCGDCMWHAQQVQQALHGDDLLGEL